MECSIGHGEFGELGKIRVGIEIEVFLDFRLSHGAAESRFDFLDFQLEVFIAGLPFIWTGHDLTCVVSAGDCLEWFEVFRNHNPSLRDGRDGNLHVIDAFLEFPALRVLDDLAGRFGLQNKLHNASGGNLRILTVWKAKNKISRAG